MIFGMHWLDFSILMTYFAMILYIGVFRGAKETKTLGDFFVAGGKWGPVISFIFIFASAIAGNEAVAVGGQAYEGGLSGVWYWWSFLFATPIYYLFCTYFRRARVYNMAEFFEMRYDRYSSSIYAVVAGIICVLTVAMVVLANAKILAGFTGVDQQVCVWTITLIVGAYVFSGGMMSALLTDIVQGLMCLLVLGVVMFPFLWIRAGGWGALQEYTAQKPEIWNLIDPKTMGIWTVLALNISAIVGGIAAPWVYNWISISKNERAATQMGWGCLWKRVITLLFAIYGIMFAIYHPGLTDPEQAWGVVMKEILPVGLLGLLITTFFAAAMSSADAFATTSSALIADYLYRRMLFPMKSLKHYLTVSRFWAVLTIILAAVSTQYIDSIKGYVKLTMTLLSFLGVPIYFGVFWRKSNRLGMWMSLLGGIVMYIIINAIIMNQLEIGFFEAIKPSFVPAVFGSTAASLIGMILGILVGPRDDDTKVKRFYVIMNTPIGQEQRLVDAGIKLPALIDSGLIDDGPEELKVEKINELYQSDSQDKIFGKDSMIELRREKGFEWYYPGFLKITSYCFGLLFFTWLITKILFVWGR